MSNAINTASTLARRTLAIIAEAADCKVGALVETFYLGEVPCLLELANLGLVIVADGTAALTAAGANAPWL